MVHEDHGVGRYVGLQTLEIDGRPAEFLMLEYADSDKLYVPVSSLHLVSRYTGSDPDTAPLHRLGSRQWEKAKRKAAQQVRDVAAELLDLYARRLAREGFAFPVDDKLYAEFASGLPLRGNARPADCDRRGARRPRVADADGPRGLRRRRLRQDRGGLARGVRRRAGRPAGGLAGADHAAGTAAFLHVQRPPGGLAGAGRIAVALPHRQRNEGGSQAPRSRAAWISSSAPTG